MQRRKKDQKHIRLFTTEQNMKKNVDPLKENNYFEKKIGSSKSESRTSQGSMRATKSESPPFKSLKKSDDM